LLVDNKANKEKPVVESSILPELESTVDKMLSLVKKDIQPLETHTLDIIDPESLKSFK
jgi:hypothetical protein